MNTYFNIERIPTALVLKNVVFIPLYFINGIKQPVGIDNYTV